MRNFLCTTFIVLSFISTSFAGSDLDRRYALETVGYLRAWDNVDGLFKDYIDRAYEQYFQDQSRFRVRDLEAAGDILNRSKISYRSLIDDRKILGQIARKMKTDSLIRTRVYKEGPNYRFNLEWLHSPKMDVISKHSFTSGDGTLGSRSLDMKLKEGLSHLIAKVPFLGQVTGRDKDWVTINIGKLSKIKKGDQLEISTLQEASVHPLLKEVVDWKFVQTGKIKIENVEDRLAFGKVMDERAGQEIARYQKITKLIQREEVVPKVQKPVSSSSLWDENFKPTLGYGGFGLWLGSVSRSYSDGTNTTSGSGILFGFKADAQIWMTGNIWAELAFGYGFFSYSQDLNNSGSSTSIGSGSLTHIKIAAAYAFWLSESFHGPKIVTRVGYHTHNYGLPSSSTNFTGDTSFGSIFLGLGGEIPISSHIGAIMSLDLGLVKSSSETVVSSGTSIGSSDVGFFVGGYYRWKKRLFIRAGIEVFAQGIDISTTSSISQTSVIFSPSLLYYL